MVQTASFSNNKEQGFSLIEILISLLLMQLVLIVLAGTAVIITKTSMKNRLRDAAVLATQDQIDEWRNKQWNVIMGYATIPPAPQNPQTTSVVKKLGKVAFTFNMTSIFEVDPVNANFVTLQVRTTWRFMGQDYSHLATQILKQ